MICVAIVVLNGLIIILLSESENGVPSLSVISVYIALVFGGSFLVCLLFLMNSILCLFAICLICCCGSGVL